MIPQRIILVGGGARSGKSDFALTLARRLGPSRLFVATAQARDEEMRERIARHRQTRGSDFRTLEEPLAVVEAIQQANDHDVIVLDCLTLWLTNLLLAGREPDAVLHGVDELAEVLRRRAGSTLVVTSEVGLGLVPETPLGRSFRDLAGRAHQQLAIVADEVYLGALGLMLRLKPGPVIPVTEVGP